MSTRPSIARRGVLAIGGAVVANLFVLGGALVVLGSSGFDPFNVGPVAISSGVGAAGATAVYAVLARLRERPDRLFVALAAAVLLLSFVTLTEAAVLEGATTSRLAVLALMHVVVAVVSVVALVGDPQ
ncbi:DUF6069 family protein [Natrinema ejinorense]|uniref:DUF6069 family protein n=1 Tax=Natrinema ejinorense TaxID=373386 RepID=UPI00118009D4|nr:DUF6069 family protein [Natrinema ejinorense]